MVPTAEVKVNLDENAIKKYIQQELDKQIHQNLLLVDINKLIEITCMSKRFLEDYILSDPRVHQHLRRRDRKKFYLYEPTIEAIKNIIDDW